MSVLHQESYLPRTCYHTRRSPNGSGKDQSNRRVGTTKECQRSSKLLRTRQLLPTLHQELRENCCTTHRLNKKRPKVRMATRRTESLRQTQKGSDQRTRTCHVRSRETNNH